MAGICPKFPGKHLATGYWGTNPRKVFRDYQVPEKIVVAKREELLTMGRPAYLFLPVTSGTRCTCFKDTNSSADRKCHTCHGTSYIPGYEKFLFATLAFSSSEHSQLDTWTLTDVTLNTTFKPHRFQLAEGATTGTAVSPDVAFSNPNLDQWAFNTDAYTRAAGQNVTVEWSNDAGMTWRPLSDLNDTVNNPGTSGSIRVRVTLSRSTAVEQSPLFEIFRLRHLRSADVNPVIAARRTEDYRPGNILILRPWEVERVANENGRGIVVDNPGDKAWTAPLDFFDTSITIDTPQAKIDDTEPGSSPFFEHDFGIHDGTRFELTQLSYNEQMLRFTWQSFDDRRVQPGEHYGLVWGAPETAERID